MLNVQDLHATVDGKEILKGLTLEVPAGEVHAIMGPNGSGKSTLAGVLAGRDAYEVTSGEVLFQGKNLLEMPPEERAREGVFLAFQYPVEIPGVNNTYFLRASVNAIRKHRGEPEMDAGAFLKFIKEKAKSVSMDPAFLNRSVNEGFSGGEKKRNEVLQLAVLEPKLAILDETDSGLDIDALKIVAEGVNRMRDPKRSFVVVTHYQRLLDYIVPDFVHVLSGGRIIKSGGKELALELDPEDRAREGLFLAFQYPVEIPGVNNTYFLRAAYNELRKHRGEEEVDAMDFLAIVKEKMKLLELPDAMLKRSVNEGFSGGEKKRNENFQMAVLEPKLAVLDETDSGLDIDALRIVAEGVNKLKRPDNASIVITHYQRLLNYIVPDFVHVLSDGQIIKSGGKELALELEEKGYDWLTGRNGAAK